jgi:carbamoyltransferase
VLTGHDGQKGSLLGPAFAAGTVRRFLAAAEVPYRRCGTEEELIEVTADLLTAGNVVGWFQGRMEFGPRALGARSILADPRRPGMQADLNTKIKLREGFRPFAPAVLNEHAAAWFDLPPGRESPYMLLTAPVTGRRRLPLSADEERVLREDPDLPGRLALPRSLIPAVTHVDYSARVQTVDAGRNPRFHRLLQAFHERTGCPVLVNTSFNVRGEPIVCTPREAYRCFLATGMDALVLEDCVVLKADLDGAQCAAGREEYLAGVRPD